MSWHTYICHFGHTSVIFLHFRDVFMTWHPYVDICKHVSVFFIFLQTYRWQDRHISSVVNIRRSLCHFGHLYIWQWRHINYFANIRRAFILICSPYVGRCRHMSVILSFWPTYVCKRKHTSAYCKLICAFANIRRFLREKWLTYVSNCEHRSWILDLCLLLQIDSWDKLLFAQKLVGHISPKTLFPLLNRHQTCCPPTWSYTCLS